METIETKVKVFSNEEKCEVMESLRKDIEKRKKRMKKLSYRIPLFFKKAKYNLMTKKPHPPYGESKDIERIDIQFENCEVFSIPRKDLSNIYLHNIRKNISICLNAVIEDYEAEDIWIVIPLEAAERKCKIFGTDEESLLNRLGAMSDKPIRDITHIYIYYNTKETECISCVWDGEDNYDNPAQKVQIEEDYLTISISKENSIRKE